MSGCLDDATNSLLSPADWRNLQRALSDLCFCHQPPEEREGANYGEVVAVLREAGAANASELYGALTKRFRILRLGGQHR